MNIEEDTVNNADLHREVLVATNGASDETPNEKPPVEAYDPYFGLHLKIRDELVGEKAPVEAYDPYFGRHLRNGNSFWRL